MDEVRFQGLEEILKTGSAEQRKAAVRELSEAGPAAGPLLVMALKDRNGGVRDTAFHAILCNPSEALAELIVPLLGHRHIEIRNLASELLIRFGGLATRPLVNLLKNGNKDERKFAADILGLSGVPDVYPYLIEALDDPEPNVAVSAAEALGNLRVQQAVGVLIDHFHACVGMEPVVIDALGKVQHPEAEDFLQKIVLERDENLAVIAIEALSSSENPEVARWLSRHLESFPASLRDMALKAILCIAARTGTPLESIVDLHCFGDGALDLALSADDGETVMQLLAHLPDSFLHARVSRLIGLMNHSNEEVRLFVAERLSSVPVEVLIEAISNVLPNLSIPGQHALMALLQNYPAERVFPILKELAYSNDAGVRIMVMQALATLDSHEARELLRLATMDPDLSVQEAAYTVLAYDPRARETMPDLFQQGLKSDDAAIIQACVTALVDGHATILHQQLLEWTQAGNIGSILACLRQPDLAAMFIEPKLAHSLIESDNAELRAAATRMLEFVDWPEAPVWLLTLMDDVDRDVRTAALQVILRRYPDQAESALLKALEDEDFWVQHLALEAIVKLGKIELVERIFPLMASSDRYVQIEAIQAILALNGEKAEREIATYLENLGEDAESLLNLAREQTHVSV